MMPLCSNPRRRHTVGRASLVFGLTLVLALWGVGPALAQFGETTQYFPQFATGGGWTTSFAIYNPTGGNITVQVNLFRGDGTAFGTHDVSIAAGGSRTLKLTPSSTLTTGWALLTSTARFSATELYQLVEGGELKSQIGVLPAVNTDEFKIFGLVQSQTAVNTGVAVANPSPSVESVMTVRRFDAAGVLLDTRSVRLAPLSQLARFLDQSPFFPGLDNFEGIIEIQASQPVSAVTLLAEGSAYGAVSVVTPAAAIAGDGSVTSLNLPRTTDAATGVVNLGGSRFLHNYGTQNTFLGSGAGNFSMTGGLNTAVGIVALQANTTGSNNTGTGYFALGSNTTGSYNTATGNGALGSNTTGANNTATGADALVKNTTGGDNTATGRNALFSNTGGSNNTATGASALLSNLTGGDNTATGNNALRANTTGNGNAAHGAGALGSNTTGSLNTASGAYALSSNSTGGSNTATGNSALSLNTTGGNNTATGAAALNLNTTGSNNTATGSGAMQANTTGSGNTAMGSAAMQANTTGVGNTVMGSDALAANTTGGNNTAIGQAALRFNTIGNNNTATGASALNFNTAGGNTATGSYALASNTTGPDNTATGSSALIANTTGQQNTAIGASALSSNTTGLQNTAIGASALYSNTTGSFNTAIGHGADISFVNLTNATAIGARARVNASNKIRLGSTAVTVLESQVGLTVVSDRNAKEGFRPIDAEDTLKKLSRVPVTSWNYIGHDPEQFRHYGPVAQDFFAAFGHDGVGRIGSETTINSSDLSGILMAAVQALEAGRKDLQAENADLRERIEKLEQLFYGSGPR